MASIGISRFDIERVRPLEPARDSGRAEPAMPCSACTVRHLTFCAPLGEEEMIEVTRIVQNLELSPGDPLFDQGEDADFIYSVTAGALRVYKLLADGRRQIVGFLFAGDFLGLADDTVYAYSAEAITHASLCRFPRRRLEALLDRYPRMERRLLGMASHELAVAQEQMLLLGRKTAREKIASFLLTLGQRSAQRGQPSNPVSVPMSRNDIGDFLGLTTETVSRTFTQLRQEKLIRLLPTGRVELLEIEALREIAHFD